LTTDSLVASILHVG